MLLINVMGKDGNLMLLVQQLIRDCLIVCLILYTTVRIKFTPLDTQENLELYEIHEIQAV